MSATTPVDVVRRFLDLLAQADIVNWGKLLAPDAVMLFPFSPPGFPTRYDGRLECEAATRQILSAVKTFEYYDIELEEGKDPEFVMATARSRATTKTGKAYGNDYVFMFRVRDGLVYYYREYFNPLPIIASFGQGPG